MHATLASRGRPAEIPWNAIDLKNRSRNSCIILHTVSSSVHPNKNPTLQLVTSHPTKVIHLGNSMQHSICCSQSNETFIEEELQTEQELQTVTGIHRNIGVMIALALLSFYRKEISPFLPQRCRFVPSCSEYSMEAYRRYGVIKGTVLTAWRLIRCNPFGSYGFDPPRWFGESKSLMD